MYTAVIIGIGNVGTHLSRALQCSSEVSIVQYLNRSQLSEGELSKRIGSCEAQKFTTKWETIKEADCYFIAVKDDEIEACIEAIPFHQKIVAHTSGSIALSSCPKQKNAVFYPLQTFSKSKELNFNEIPICIETSENEVYKVIEKIAHSISKKVHYINSFQRRQLHLSAVFVCNFVNHMYHIGNELCIQNNIDSSILEALIQETAAKVKILSPKDAQTGPALRNDKSTLQNHEEMLEGYPKYIKIYRLLSSSIASLNHEN